MKQEKSPPINGWLYEVNYNRDKFTFDFKVEPSPDKRKEKPKALWLYYSLWDKHIDTLYNKQIYARHPFQLNDPFDCLPDLISVDNLERANFINSLTKTGHSEDEISDLFNNNREKLNGIFLNDLWHKAYPNLGIISFSEKEDNLLMWAYYAGHNGFAVKYDISKLPEYLYGPFQIHYQDEFKQINFLSGGLVSLLYQTNVKGLSWQHENEWRILVFSKKGMTIPGYEYLQQSPRSRLFELGGIEIKEIVLGLNFFRDHITKQDPDNRKYEAVFDTNEIELKEDAKNKKRIIDWIITNNNIKSSVIRMQPNNKFNIESKEIKIERKEGIKYNFEML